MNPDCQSCGGSGICGGPPDNYYECPECTGEDVTLDDVRDDRTYLYGDNAWT